MNEQLLFLLTLETTALIVLVVLLIYYTVQRSKKFEKTFSSELKEQYDLLFKTQLTTMQKELEALMRATLKDARAQIEKNNTALTTLSKEKLAELTERVDVEVAKTLKTEQARVAETLAAYQEKKCAELDAASDTLLERVLQDKLWKTLKTSDKHALSVAALKELLATGELQK